MFTQEEDNKLSGEELGKKLEKLMKQSEVQLQSLNGAVHQLRATCYGQDRYWRRYWSLPTAGGVFVEAIESADPDVIAEQELADCNSESRLKSVDDIKDLIGDVDSVRDPSADREVSSIIGDVENTDLTNNVSIDVFCSF